MKNTTLTPKAQARGQNCAQQLDNVTMVVPPMIQVMMTGVQFARIFGNGRVQLTYEDCETESARISAEQLSAGRDNFFSLVSAVQSKRPDTLRSNQQ